MKGFKKIVMVAAATLALGFSANVQAMPLLSGEVGTTAAYSIAIGTNLSDATMLNISNAEVKTASGDFNAIFPTVPAMNAPINHVAVFDLTGGGLPGLLLWDDGAGTSFTLNSFSIIFRQDNFLLAEGFGTFSSPGFATTPGTYELSVQETGVTFSAGHAAVPEPGTMMLMGSGLLGLGLWRRFKK